MKHVKHVLVFLLVTILTFGLLTHLQSLRQHQTQQRDMAALEAVSGAALSVLSEIPWAEPRPEQVLDEPSQPLENWQQARFISEMFPTTQRMIRLEVTPDSLIGQINQALFFDDSIFVTDAAQTQILMFDINGSFIKTVASQGQGPGELGSTRHMQRIFDGQFGVSDAIQGRIHVFDSSGMFRFSTPKPFEATNYLVPNWSFHWPQKDRLTIAGTKAPSDGIPNHVIAEVIYNERNEPQTLIPKIGFGVRNNRIQQRSGIGSAFYAFAMVQDRIWAAPPNLHIIHIYDLDGHLLKTITPKCPKPLTAAVWEEIPGEGREFHQNYQASRGDYCSTNGLYVFDDIVLVNHNQGYLPFDHEGRQLSDRHLIQDMDIRGSHQGLAVCAVSVERFPEGTKLAPSILKDYQELREIGFPVEDPEQENPALKLAIFKK